MKTEMNRATNNSHIRCARLRIQANSIASRAFSMLLSLIWILALPSAYSIITTEGDLDPDFIISGGFSGYIHSTALQPDGKIIIGGVFSAVSGTTRNNIARLNADGSLDTSFDPGTGANSTIQSTTLQSDGKIIIGGDFTEVGGVSRNRIARLNDDGSLDTSFDPGTGVDFELFSMTLQSDGKIIIGGSFNNVDGVGRNHIARLNTDGTLDTSFDPGTGANNNVSSVALQQDGKIIIGGEFSSVDGVSRIRIARLNADGSLDTSFDPGAGGIDAIIWTIALQPDGQIIIGGEFFNVDGVGRNRIARLNTDGTLDTSFDPGTGANDIVWSISLQTNGKIVIGGWFSDVNGDTRNWIARLNSDGEVDSIFDPNANQSVYSLVLQSDGKIIVGGDFTEIGGESRDKIARLLNNSVTQTLSVASSARVEWLRGGASPEVSRVEFSVSTDERGSWTTLGDGSRISGGWELTGLGLPSDGTLRAQAYAYGSRANGSSQWLEEHVNFSSLSVPEIYVEGNGFEIIDGDTTPSLIDDTDFGQALVSEGEVVKSFIISNWSSEDLTLGTVTLGGANPEDFAVTTAPSSPVSPEGETTLEITFAPTVLGVRTATVSFSNNDWDENPMDFDIQGTAPFTLTAGTNPAPPATSVTIPFNLNSLGTVSGVSFTIDYDSGTFSNPVIAKTTVSNSAQLLVNDSSPGQVEVALAFADGSAFASGDQEILTLTLDVDAGAPSGPYPIVIGSSLTTFEMVDAESGVLASYSNDGTISVNNPPVATADSESTNEDTAAFFDVLANDTDVEFDTLAVTIVSGPTNGTAAVQTDETVLYTPSANFHGSDSFTYTINDGLVDSNEVTVSITVNSIDDPASLDTDTFSVNEDVTLMDSVTATDLDGLTNGAVYSILSQPANGSVSIGATTGEFTYIPDANFSDADTFDVRVTDDDSYTADFTITVNVQPLPDDPTAVDDAFSTNEHETLTILFTALTSNDFDVDGGTFTVNTAASDTASFRSAPVTVVNGNSFLYDPTEVQFIRDLQLGQSLIDTFSYTIEDPTGRTDSGTVSITVNGFNHTPVATADSESTDEDTEAFFDVLANDSDDDSDALTVDIVTHPSSGTAVVQGNETVLYTPNANFHGSDSFTYTINDGLVDSNEVTVDIAVNSVDDPASLDTVTFSVNEDVTLVDTVTATDLDGLTNMAVYSIFSQPTNGSVSIGDVSGEFTYIPDADFSDADTFEIRVTDDDSYTADFTITVNVQPLPDDPTAVDDDFETDEDQTLTILFTELLGNDFDVDGGTVTVDAVSSDTSSSNSAPITVVNNDSFVYDPTQVQSFIELEPGDTGSDTFSYTIEDPTGRTTSGTITIAINGVGYEGDLTGLEFDGVNYEDNILDVTDFVQAGRYLVHLDFLDENGRLFSSADTWPADTGGDGIIGLSDWIQTARYVAGLDPISGKFGPTIGGGGGLANQPATEDIFSGAAGISSLNADSNEDSKAAVELLISGDNFEAGKTGVVTLGVDSTGNFSSLGTTIEFDPALMTYVKSSLVEALAGSLTLIINDRKADQGLIGILIASNPGKTLPAGFLEVLKIEFDISVDHNNGPLEISLNDKVLRSVVSNRNAQKLEFESQNTTTNVQSITTFSQWAAIHETRSLNENGEMLVLVENEDSDGDGLSNAVEFVLGTDPVKKDESPVRTSFKQVSGQAVFEAATEVITERGDIEVEIIPLNGEFMETGATGIGTSLFETRFGREKRIFQFPLDQQSGFFIIRIKNKNP